MFRLLQVFIGFILCFGGFLIFKKNVNQEQKGLTIGIIQTASHPALDGAREGFITELDRLTGGDVAYIVQNAEGSLSQAQRIAESFHAHKKIDALYAIATPAVQAAARAEKQKPIFIAAVSDPDSLGIANNENLCGTTDQVDTEKQAELILKIFPKAESIAILYNPGERNSQVGVQKILQSLEKRGLKGVTYGIHSENEIVQVVDKAARKNDILLAPTDNLIGGSITLVSREALKKGIPLFVSDIHLVSKGALLGLGADYSLLGKQTAEMAYRVLVLKNLPDNVGIVHPSESRILMNRKVMESFQMTLPEELLPSIEWASH